MAGGQQWTKMYKPPRKNVCKFFCDPNGHRLTEEDKKQLLEHSETICDFHFFIILTPSDTERSHDCITSIPLTHKKEGEPTQGIIIPLEPEYIESSRLPKETLILCSRITRVRREDFDYKGPEKWGIITKAGMEAIKIAINKFLDQC
jgi:hypothetical protein